MNNEQVKQWLSNKFQRINRLWIGFVSGIIVPLLTLVITYFNTFRNYTPAEFVKFLIDFHIVTKLLSLCVLPNLGIFFLFLYPDFRRAAMGTLSATFLMALIVILIQVYLGILEL